MNPAARYMSIVIAAARSPYGICDFACATFTPMFFASGMTMGSAMNRPKLIRNIFLKVFPVN